LAFLRLAASMTKSRSQELLEKAAEERRRRRDWLLPFMQNSQPRQLTKDDLRSAATRALNVEKTLDNQNSEVVR
jgi:predicted Zn-dependent peptidase